MALTDVEIRKTKPTDKPQRLHDQRGLYLEVAPSGGKWWRFKFRFRGKEKRLSLGVYPEITLKEARERRDALRKLISNGVDPAEHRKIVKTDSLEQAANSFEIIAKECFIKFKPTWSPSHANKVIQLFERDIFPWIGNAPVIELTPVQLLTVLRRIEERGALETAHRALGHCGQVFRYAVATRRAARDPTQDLRGALPPYKRNHFAAETDPKRFGEYLRVINGYEGMLHVRCALKLAPLVFVRPGELRKAEWADINLETAEWRFTVTKTQTSHIVPLSRQALAILRELYPLTGHGRYVFPSTRTKDRPMSDNAVLAALRRLGISKEEMSGHGFRATARTLLDEVLGFRPDFIEHQLAHAVRDPNGRAYNRTAHLGERRKMMQAWADYLDQLKDHK
ncbi:MAG: integrase arm-type DNA-binding domain-containing protein [Gammaproteobacteria bacterium]